MLSAAINVPCQDRLFLSGGDHENDGGLVGGYLRCGWASNSRRRTVLDLGQPAESNWGGVTADLLAERESGEGGEFADRSERTHASLSLATNYSSAQRIAAIKSLTCGKTLL